MTQIHTQPGSSRHEDSLASIQVDRLSVEDEAASMNRLRVWQLRGAIVAAIVLLGAGAMWMKGVDRRGAYSELGTGIAALRAGPLSAFVQCAAPGAQPSQLAAAGQLPAALLAASEHTGKGYTRALLHCSPLLEQAGLQLAALNVPSAVAPQAAALRAALSDLQATVESAVTVPSYDSAKVVALTQKVAAGWQAYDEKQVALQTALRAHTK